MPKTAASKVPVKDPIPAARPKPSYAEQRERDKAIKRARKKVEDAETEIARLEGVVKAIEEQLAAGDATDTEIYTRHAAATKDLENAMSIWELASLDLEEMQKKQ